MADDVRRQVSEALKKAATDATKAAEDARKKR